MTTPHLDAFLITCEHGGNRIPAAYRAQFRGQRKLLDSHRGYDPGALVMARALSRAFRAPLVSSTVTRLLVDLNRSVGHPQLFSASIRSMPAIVRGQIVIRHYRPYREEIERLVRRAVRRGRRMVHVSSHSFTPVLQGCVRTADVGLLYDPARPGEASLCAKWKSALALAAPRLRIRRNYPYAGKGDGVTSYLRARFAPDAYVGIELEINQQIVRRGGRRWPALRATLIESLRTALAG